MDPNPLNDAPELMDLGERCELPAGYGAALRPKTYFTAFWCPRNRIWRHQNLCFCCAKM